MAETLPEIAVKQAQQMTEQYGSCDIYATITDGISKRATTILRTLSATDK